MQRYFMNNIVQAVSQLKEGRKGRSTGKGEEKSSLHSFTSLTLWQNCHSSHLPLFLLLLFSFLSFLPLRQVGGAKEKPGGQIKRFAQCARRASTDIDVYVSIYAFVISDNFKSFFFFLFLRVKNSLTNLIILSAKFSKNIDSLSILKN